MPPAAEGAERLRFLGGRGEAARSLAKLFPDCAPDQLFISEEPWPELSGCLAILFTSRSGSTYLSREIASRYRLGHIGESLNPPQLRSRAAKAGLRSPAGALRHSVRVLSEEGWFGFKAGTVGVTVAERSGFMPQFIAKTHFVLLFRRDLAAQAVSAVKAQWTGRFHSTQTETRVARESDYAREAILRKARSMVRGMRALDAYARASGRPVAKLFYEDYAQGDFTSAMGVCDAFTLPRRTEPKNDPARAVSKIGDALNETWLRRFREEGGAEAADLLEQYEQLMRA